MLHPPKMFILLTRFFYLGSSACIYHHSSIRNCKVPLCVVLRVISRCLFGVTICSHMSPYCSLCFVLRCSSWLPCYRNLNRSLGVCTEDSTKICLENSMVFILLKILSSLMWDFQEHEEFWIQWNKYGMWNLHSRDRMNNFLIYLSHMPLWYLSTLKMLTILDIPTREEIVPFLFYCQSGRCSTK